MTAYIGHDKVWTNTRIHRCRPACVQQHTRGDIQVAATIRAFFCSAYGASNPIFRYSANNEPVTLTNVHVSRLLLKPSSHAPRPNRLRRSVLRHFAKSPPTGIENGSLRGVGGGDETIS